MKKRVSRSLFGAVIVIVVRPMMRLLLVAVAGAVGVVRGSVCFGSVLVNEVTHKIKRALRCVCVCVCSVNS